MRTVTFPVGTHRTTQRGVTWVLQAIEHAGQRVWEGEHVVRDIYTYASQHCGAEFADLHAAYYALMWLVERGYAERSTDGRRHQRFALLDDVSTELTAPTNAWDKYVSARATMPATPAPERPAARTNGVQPPLPFDESRMGPKYRRSELDRALADWGQSDPRRYSAWVDQVLDHLNEELTK